MAELTGTINVDLGVVAIPGFNGTASSLTVQEQDGVPTVNNVTTIKVSNGTLTDNTGGVVSITTGGGGGGGITNSAPANTIMKSDGTNAVSSSITDNGTTVAINTNKFTVTESNGNTVAAGSVTAPSFVTNGAAAGVLSLLQGSAPSLVANAVQIYAPASVAGGGLAYVLVGTGATGFMLATNSSGTMTVTHVGSTGSGNVVLATGPTLSAPVLGTPASGNLSSCTADGTNAVGFLGIPQNSKSAAYTTILSDAGKCIFHPASDANARTFTIDSNANVAYVIGTVIQFINRSANNVTIAITSDTLTFAPSGGTGSRTLAQYGVAYAEKIGTTEWLISGNTALT